MPFFRDNRLSLAHTTAFPFNLESSPLSFPPAAHNHLSRLHSNPKSHFLYDTWSAQVQISNSHL